MKLISALAAVFLLTGCAVTTSVGLLKDFPSRKVPDFHCYVLAYEFVPPFVVYDDATEPKRAVLWVNLFDDRGSKLKKVIGYKGKLAAAPGNLIPTAKLSGSSFTMNETNPVSGEKWTVEFRRDSEGQFRVVREDGAFDH